MKKYKSHDEMMAAMEGLTPAQLFSALYLRQNDVKEFGIEFAQDPLNGITYTRLAYFSEVLTKLLMSSVRADAEANNHDATEALQNVYNIVLGELNNALKNDGKYE